VRFNLLVTVVYQRLIRLVTVKGFANRLARFSREKIFPRNPNTAI
jgi:hypothetical protein